MDTTNTIKIFEYKTTRGGLEYFPFRVGDLVKVKDWGETYSSYTAAFKYFYNDVKPPYYSNNYSIRDCQTFKIWGMAEHVDGHNIVTYIKDIYGHDNVIAADGLELVKQFPLRKGEKTKIKLKKLKL